jgi:hypothetical protein
MLSNFTKNSISCHVFVEIAGDKEDRCSFKIKNFSQFINDLHAPVDKIMNCWLSAKSARVQFQSVLRFLSMETRVATRSFESQGA